MKRLTLELRSIFEKNDIYSRLEVLNNKMLEANFWQDKNNSKKIFISSSCNPQTIDLIKTRTEPFGLELIIGNGIFFGISYELSILNYNFTKNNIFCSIPNLKLKTK